MAQPGKSTHDTGARRDSESELRNILMSEFCRRLESSNVAPMHVLQMMARSLGSIYREISIAHQNGQCPCGWVPEAAADMEALRALLDDGAASPENCSLRLMPVAGRA